MQFFEFDDFDVRDRFYNVEEKTERLKLLLESLPTERQTAFKDMCMRAYVYHDSALDGLVVSNEEINSVFNSETSVHYAKSRVWQEVRNHRDMLFRLRQDVDRIKSLTSAYKCDAVYYHEVIELHQLLYGSVLKKEAGKLRSVVPLHSAYFHEFVPLEQIEEKLIDLCEKTQDPEFRAQHPINQAMLFHFHFMKIQPFLEGSGKIGRLLMNRFLTQGGYDLAIIHGSERQRYYETLRDGAEHLRELLLDSMESSLETQIKYVQEVDFRKTSNRIVMRTVGLHQ